MKTIRGQLIRKFLLVFVLLSGCGGTGVYFSTREALLEQFDDALRARANSLSSGIEQSDEGIEFKLNEEFMREFDDGEPVEFFQLRRADGATIKRSESLSDGNLPTRFGTFRRPKFWNLELPSGHRGRAVGYTFSTIVSDDASAGTEPAELTVVFASDRRELDEALTSLALVLAGCGALLLAATVWIVPWVLRRELAPLDQLAEQATRINAASLSTRFPTETVPGEIKPISERLNDLLSRLQESFERERRFSGDLAHELRTPIAELRSLAELALKWPESRAPETDSDALDIAIQMEGIVTRLLELLRSEHGQLVPRHETVRLFDLVKAAWEPFGETVAQKQLQVAQNIPEKSEIQSDPVLLRSILTNLMDNAVEYTPEGGVIRIDVRVGEGQFTIQIKNTVEHLETADLARLFDRFWRKDAARSGTKHSGLGLSLARAFAQAMGAELTAAIDRNGHLTLTVSGGT